MLQVLWLAMSWHEPRRQDRARGTRSPRGSQSMGRCSHSRHSETCHCAKSSCGCGRRHTTHCTPNASQAGSDPAKQSCSLPTLHVFWKAKEAAQGCRAQTPRWQAGRRPATLRHHPRVPVPPSSTKSAAPAAHQPQEKHVSAQHRRAPLSTLSLPTRHHRATPALRRSARALSATRQGCSRRTGA